MKVSRDIRSLSVFKRDSSKFLMQIKETGETIIFTVNGKAALVVSDPDSYQEFLRLKQQDPTLELIPRMVRKSTGKKQL